ncbi:hypothetical protein GIB67_003759 [Kingdonia uniflora]|uniref:CSN8/PSMD8/EIF3K domain-containing protein n=1 Tax=Kingdonia uniflora TaxID=39325 RepID=A0A7J7MSE3_9MAGN|nr:hypothetical protein GIB67_003759 [Kingdonia uniflora]
MVRSFDCMGLKSWQLQVQCIVSAVGNTMKQNELRDDALQPPKGIRASYELYTKRMFELLVSAYSTISIEDTALFLGMNREDAITCTVPLLKFRLRNCDIGIAIDDCRRKIGHSELEEPLFDKMLDADVVQQGWTVDSASEMLTVKKLSPTVKEQKPDPNKLQRLTEYVFHLEH